MTRQLELIDNLVASGCSEFTFEQAREAFGGSPATTANALRRLRDKGLVDRVVRGRYAVRPLGSLGTSALTEDLALAVGTAFKGREHRIAYLSALSDLGLLSHPTRTICVASTVPVHFSTVSRRPLRLVLEQPRTIHLETEAVGRSWRSSLERALFESALRVDLAGGVERLAEAMANGAAEANPERIARLAQAFGPKGRAAERRLASLAQALSFPLHLQPQVSRQQPVIGLDPRDQQIEWVDNRFRVAWNATANELEAVVAN